MQTPLRNRPTSSELYETRTTPVTSQSDLKIVSDTESDLNVTPMGKKATREMWMAVIVIAIIAGLSISTVHYSNKYHSLLNRQNSVAAMSTASQTGNTASPATTAGTGQDMGATGSGNNAAPTTSGTNTDTSQ